METTAYTTQAWEIEQLLKLLERQPELMAQAIRRPVEDDEGIRWAVVVGAYRDEQINLGKAAELLELSEIKLRQRFIEPGIPLRIGPADLDECTASNSYPRLITCRGCWRGAALGESGQKRQNPCDWNPKTVQ